MPSWPRIRGIVCEHVIRSSGDRAGTGMHQPSVIVQYTANGRIYKVQCHSPTRLGFAHAQHARAVIKPFKVGKRVALYVDPRDQSRALLYPPETSAMLLMSFGAFFLLLVGFGIWNGAAAVACGV